MLTFVFTSHTEVANKSNCVFLAKLAPLFPICGQYYITAVTTCSSPTIENLIVPVESNLRALYYSYNKRWSFL
jgi:hypothetical protein